MLRAHLPIIIAGLAVGAFVGTQYAGSIAGYPPYSWILGYMTS